MKYKRHIIAGIVGASLLLGMTACSPGKSDSGLNMEGGYSVEEASQTKAMVIGDYDIYMDEMILYAMQVIYMQGYTSASWNENVESKQRDTALSLLRENKIIYDYAVKQGTELNESDMEYVNNMVDGFKGRFPQDILDKYGISDDVISRIFEEQAIVSKFENDVRNDIGQTLQDGFTEDYQDVKFHTIYYMLFPTVEVNENQEPATDEEGNYIYVSEDKKAEVKAQAEEAREKLQNGASYEEVAEEYAVAAYSSERAGFIGAYDEETNQMLDTLKEGECTEVLEDTLGYSIIVMLTADDESMRDSYIQTLVSENLSTQYDEEKNMWLASIPVDEEKDMEGTVWADFDMASLVADMETVGVVGTN